MWILIQNLKYWVSTFAIATHRKVKYCKIVAGHGIGDLMICSYLCKIYELEIKLVFESKSRIGFFKHTIVSGFLGFVA